MNYLAHAYLSFNDPQLLVGNLISDFVKGKKKLDYPEGIRNGITLHRAIDSFTDTHESTRQAKLFFREAYGLYSGALVDVLYDHFLANDLKEFPEQGPGPGLAAFAERCYEQLSPYEPVFPERFRRMFPYMRSQNWLYNYRFKQGILNSFEGVSRRALYMASPARAGELFETHYQELGACYQSFFPAVKDFAFTFLRQLPGTSNSFTFGG